MTLMPADPNCPRCHGSGTDPNKPVGYDYCSCVMSPDRTDKPHITSDASGMKLPDPKALEEHRLEIVREFLKFCDFEPTAQQVLLFAEAYADTLVSPLVECLKAIGKRRTDGSLVYSQMSMYEFAKSALEYYKEQKQNAS